MKQLRQNDDKTFPLQINKSTARFEVKKEFWRTCAECQHEVCRFCKQCHNQDCDEFCNVVQPCYDRLLKD